MDYRQATRYLISLGNEVRASTADGIAAAKLGLENISVLLDELTRPQDSYPSILIAGTNGKGSVAAMMESILRADGTLTYTPTGAGARSLTVRHDIPLEFRHVENYLLISFTFGLVAAEPDWSGSS